MLQIELNMYQAVAVAALVLLLGRFLVSKIPFLTKYCIPEPVVGGVVYAVVHLILRSAGILEISFDNTLQSFFMTVFFCSVGYTACFRLLKKGGVQVLLFLLVSIIMVALQNGLGAVLAGLIHTGINARKPHDGAAARKTAHIANFSYELGAECRANTKHFHHYRILRQRSCQRLHLLLESS